MMMSFAPLAINSRNASGKARSQQMRMPTGPRGVWKLSCGAWVDEVRCGRSGCLRTMMVSPKVHAAEEEAITRGSFFDTDPVSPLCHQ